MYSQFRVLDYYRVVGVIRREPKDPVLGDPYFETELQKA
jgi:hypothetical protein